MVGKAPGEVGSGISSLTWVAQGPGAVDEADVSRQAGGQDAVGQRDQPAAPLDAAVPVAAAEPLVEAEPGQQAAGCTQGQREQHPVLGTAGHKGSETQSEQRVQPVAVSAQPSTALVRNHPGAASWWGCLLLTDFLCVKTTLFSSLQTSFHPYFHPNLLDAKE